MCEIRQQYIEKFGLILNAQKKIKRIWETFKKYITFKIYPQSFLAQNH